MPNLRCLIFQTFNLKVAESKNQLLGYRTFVNNTRNVLINCTPYCYTFLIFSYIFPYAFLVQQLLLTILSDHYKDYFITTYWVLSVFLSGTNIHYVENGDVHIFVQGLNPRTRSDSIQSYFENVGKPACVRDKILFNLDHTEALIIYQQKPGKTFSASKRVQL